MAPGYFLRHLLRGWFGVCPDCYCLVPRHFALLLFPSHGPLRFVTSHSRFALASVPNTKHLRRWESSDTEQVACSRRSVRGDAWNRLLNMSFIIKLVRPRQMLFFLFFSSPSCFLAILRSSAASINNWPSYLTSSQLDFTDFANNAKITHVA